MLIEHEDFNGAERHISEKYQSQWADVVRITRSLPLHVKASDQAGIQGEPIFDAVGTNAYLKEEFDKRGWKSRILIPKEYKALGKDVDFGKGGLIIEVQFSNYPFLLNNLFRSEMFFRSGVPLAEDPTELLVIITKSVMFPAPQATLYYEQAVEQVETLARYGVFNIPTRIVGLLEKKDAIVDAEWTTYGAARYSRTIDCQRKVRVQITPKKPDAPRCELTFA